MTKEETTEEIAQALDEMAEQFRQPVPLNNLSETLHSARRLAEMIVENDEGEFSAELIEALRPVSAELEALCETVDQKIFDEEDTTK
ncbi:hypothetical protein [Thioclava sp.]|uniref:hypothetical protein n=1 Tax=Thioclava sp. TaxID=1933450 RepID=UPI003241D1E2